MLQFTPFNTKLECETSGYQSNCGLNCLAHFLIAKLKSGELQSRFGNHPGYQLLLACFVEYHGLEPSITWEDVNQVFEKKFVDPISQEMVFGPVLRLFLGKVLAQSTVQEALWNTFAASAIGDYVRKEWVDDVAQSLLLSNPTWFKSLKENYLGLVKSTATQLITTEENDIAANKFLANWENTSIKIALREYLTKGKTTQENIFFKTYSTWIAGLKIAYDDRMSQVAEAEKDQVTNDFFVQLPPVIPKALEEMVSYIRKVDILENQFLPQAKKEWDEQAGKTYAQYMGNPRYSQLVSACQLSELAETLEMNIDVYENTTETPYFKDLKDPKATRDNNRWLLKVYNSSRGHWTYEEPSADLAEVTKHNQHYRRRRSWSWGISVQQIRNAFKQQVVDRVKLAASTTENIVKEPTIASLAEEIQQQAQPGQETVPPAVVKTNEVPSEPQPVVVPPPVVNGSEAPAPVLLPQFTLQQAQQPRDHQQLLQDWQLPTIADCIFLYTKSVIKLLTADLIPDMQQKPQWINKQWKCGITTSARASTISNGHYRLSLVHDAVHLYDCDNEESMQLSHPEFKALQRHLFDSLMGPFRQTVLLNAMFRHACDTLFNHDRQLSYRLNDQWTMSHTGIRNGTYEFRFTDRGVELFDMTSQIINDRAIQEQLTTEVIATLPIQLQTIREQLHQRARFPISW